MRRLQRTEGVRQIGVLFQEQLLVRELQSLDVLLRETTALQADEVQPAGHARIPIHDHERRHILCDLRQTADDGVHADPAELVEARHRGKDRVVLHHHMPGDAGRVRHDDVVAELAVVRHVGVAEEKIVVADAGRRLRHRAAMDRRVFPEHIVVADLQVSRLPEVFEILRLHPDGRERKELIVPADLRVAFHHHMGVQHAVIPDLHIRPDHAIRTDADIVADVRERRDDGGGVDHARILRRSARF